VIVIDGNDGTGKTTLVKALEGLGLLARDRGLPTKASDDGVPPRESWPRGERYLILDVPVEVSRERLRAAGKDLEERYHTVQDLSFYRARYLEVAKGFGVEPIDSSGPIEQTVARALKQLGLSGPVRVGIPKGRLLQALLPVLGKAGVDFSALAPRQLSLTVGGVRYYLLKPRSIAQLVALGFLDAGFCGRDLLMESGYDDRLEVFHDLKTQPVQLCVGATSKDIVDRPPERPVAIATEFPLLASRWAFGKNLSHIILASWGSTEAWVPDLADVIVDVVETGATMQANGLVLLETILESTTVMVQRRDGILAHTKFGQAIAGGAP
jgi:ATP phosphoribosyltransferase